MISFLLLLVIFIIGYAIIAFEHSLEVDKAVPALFIGVILWAIYALNAESILNLNFSPQWQLVQDAGKSIQRIPQNISNQEINPLLEHIIEIGKSQIHFVTSELAHHLVEIAEILFFLLGAMTIVETVDQYRGFDIITKKIKTNNKVKLFWILSVLAFFMSAVLDNLTTTIVMVALLRKLIGDQKTRWFYASIVILAANAGGAWSPIGDVTTIMLWVKGNVTTIPIITNLILPSLATLLVPLTIVSFMHKGTITKPEIIDNGVRQTSNKVQTIMLILGVGVLLFVPIFKTFTHLPPYLGMLFGFATIWLVTEILIMKKSHIYDRRTFSIYSVLKKIDIPTIFFFLGILIAVAALQSAGHLAILAGWLDETTNQNIYIINLAIGVLSSIVDNVPLVAGAMGMYNISEVGAFAQDGAFWQFLAYCAGTGGSILIIGSAAGVAAMGLEKISFIWYLKKISLLALIGYIAGAIVFYLQTVIF